MTATTCLVILRRRFCLRRFVAVISVSFSLSPARARGPRRGDRGGAPTSCRPYRSRASSTTSTQAHTSGTSRHARTGSGLGSTAQAHIGRPDRLGGRCGVPVLSRPTGWIGTDDEFLKKKTDDERTVMPFYSSRWWIVE